MAIANSRPISSVKLSWLANSSSKANGSSVMPSTSTPSMIAAMSCTTSADSTSSAGRASLSRKRMASARGDSGCSTGVAASMPADAGSKPVTKPACSLGICANDAANSWSTVASSSAVGSMPCAPAAWSTPSSGEISGGWSGRCTRY